MKAIWIKRLRGIWAVVSNKYIATLIIFALMMCFSENNIFVTLRLRSELTSLQKEQKRLQTEMRNDSIHLKVLKGDREALERYGREVYYLRRADEDVFVFGKE